MPDSVKAHVKTGFSQILYPLVLDTIITNCENCEWELCVWLNLNKRLALEFTIYTVFFIFCGFPLKKLVAY